MGAFTAVFAGGLTRFGSAAAFATGAFAAAAFAAPAFATGAFAAAAFAAAAFAAAAFAAPAFAATALAAVGLPDAALVVAETTLAADAFGAGAFAAGCLAATTFVVDGLAAAFAIASLAARRLTGPALVAVADAALPGVSLVAAFGGVGLLAAALAEDGIDAVFRAVGAVRATGFLPVPLVSRVWVLAWATIRFLLAPARPASPTVG